MITRQSSFSILYSINLDPNFALKYLYLLLTIGCSEMFEVCQVILEMRVTQGLGLFMFQY